MRPSCTSSPSTSHVTRQIRGVVDLVGRHELGPQRCRVLPRLAREPLRACGAASRASRRRCRSCNRRSRRGPRSGDARRTRRPMTKASSASQSGVSTCSEQPDVVVGADQRDRELREQRRVRRQVATRLRDVAARSSARGRRSSTAGGRAARSRRPAYACSGAGRVGRTAVAVDPGGEQRADVGVRQLDHAVALGRHARPCGGASHR